VERYLHRAVGARPNRTQHSISAASKPITRRGRDVTDLASGIESTASGNGAGAAADLRRRLVDELREDLLEKAAKLPLRNHAALGRVVTLCRDPNVSARGVAIEAARDEAFAALLLRVANSAYSASVSRIATFTHAIARLGFDLVQGLAVASMGAPGFGAVAKVTDDRAGALRELHRHSVRTGLVARALSPGGVDPEVALTAGVLHNLGLSVTALFAPKAFHILLAAAARGEQLPGVEEEALGFTHAELGALLAERWAYPPALVHAIREHDAPAPAGQLASLVQVSDLAVRAVGIGIEPPLPLDPEVAAAAGVDLGQLADRLTPLLEAQERLEERMQEELDRMGA
jgi:HD-like signal output (HDOD) protein